MSLDSTVSRFIADAPPGEITSVVSKHVETYNINQFTLVELDNGKTEHYPSEVGFGVFPQPDSTIAIVIVDSRYSPQNFWNGRWRSWYLLDPASGRISGSIEIDVHYFEDGNVRLKTRKEIGVVDAKSPLVVVNRIAQAESKYQEDVNRAFVGLNENEFKALRRQLPVTRSKMNWGKAIGTYRLGKGKYTSKRKLIMTTNSFFIFLDIGGAN
ncbi:hypothetical protein DV495_003278 [Geotrichum candidum]|nr:hypothetical protein DV495_003278 [Geotrichum candidum]KAF7496775.1 hypothetical protein DV113_005192 [Geotrichum candidum]KAI8133555.1 hypothetical protein DUD61_002775 [Geotrichum candidum]KAI9210567.1 hypothetical protein DS838_004539 [Geotrichum bryndzae]